MFLKHVVKHKKVLVRTKLLFVILAIVRTEFSSDTYLTNQYEYHMDFLTKKLQRVLILLLVLLPGLCLQAKDNQTLSLDLLDVPLQQAFKVIESQTPYRFSYKASIIGSDGTVTIKCKDATVQTVMDQILKGKNLTYEIVSPTSIVILEKKASQNVAKTQLRTVTGQVLDRAGEPVIGATVRISGTTKGTSTDADGNFVIDAAKGDVLDVYCIGYDLAKIKVGDKSNVSVVMDENTEMLDDVVVIGYGTTERKRVTSAITTIKGDNIPKGLSGATIATALKGSVTGLDVSGYNGPNSGQGFQLRGVASINSSQGPLIVIDGVPGGSLYHVNPEEIESIDVLKDASAGAIYGTRAAAGVILITTKRGKAGQTKVTYSYEATLDHMRKRPEMLSAEEFIAEGIGDDYGSSTDWYGEMTQENAWSQKHVLTLNGGSENARVFASLLYEDMNAVFKHDTRRDYSGRINADFKALKGRLEFSTRLMVRQKDADWRTGVSQLQNALTLNPTIPLMSPSNPGEYNVEEAGLGYYTSPVANNEYRKALYRQQYLLATGVLKINIMKGLSMQGSANLDYRPSRYYYWYDPRHKDCITGKFNGSAEHQWRKATYRTFEAYANFNRDFGKNSVDAVVGWSFYQNSGLGFTASNKNFSVAGVEGWNLGEGTYLIEGKAGMSSSKDMRQRLLSYFGRVNYSFDNKYMLAASIRREGSSKFGPNNRWGTFWSLSGGWRINQEKFISDVDWLNDLKVRVGYGVTGNNGLPSGISTPIIKTWGKYIVDGQWVTGYSPEGTVNKNIKWEEKKELNIGFDFSLFNERLWGRFDWYDRQVDDLIYSTNAPIPPYFYPTIYSNVGQLSNTGVELELGGVILNTKGVKWTSNLRISHNESKIKKITNDVNYINGPGFPDPGSPGPGARITPNSQIGQFWVFRNAGVDENGMWLIYDKDNNVVPAKGNTVEDNRVYKGNGIPKAIIGFDNNITWKGFDLGIQLRSWLGFNVFNQQDMYYGIPSKSKYNVLKKSYQRMRHIKDDTKFINDYFLEKGDFLKIEYITLGYTLNLKKFTNDYLDSFRVYLTMRDVAMFTHYKGYNPEVDITGLFPSVESTSRLYPQTTRYTIGLQLNF